MDHNPSPINVSPLRLFFITTAALTAAVLLYGWCEWVGRRDAALLKAYEADRATTRCLDLGRGPAIQVDDKRNYICSKRVVH